MKIMVLAGGNDQIILIQHIRQRYANAVIILADYLDNPVAKKYADYHIQISTLDKELVLETAEKEGIERIFTACTDQALVTMAYVAEKMKLPTYLTYEQALSITGKIPMKKIMVDADIPTSRYVEVDKKEDLESIALDFPLVIKPTDSNSSKGICKVNDKEELLSAYDVAMSYSRGKRVVLEEYFEGKEYSVDVWVTDGKTDILLITETIKNREKTDGFQIVESYYDYKVHEKLAQILNPIIQKLCDAFEIQMGPMIIQVLFDGKEVSVIELSARTGGGSKIDLIQKLAGFNVIDHLLDCFEEECHMQEAKPYQGYAVMHYVYMKNGMFKGTKGLDELYPNTMEKYFMYKEEGTKIEKAEKSSDRVMGYLLMGKTKEELFRKEELVQNKLEICNEHDENVWIKEVYLKKEEVC